MGEALASPAPMKRLWQVLVLASLVAGGYLLGSYVETRRVAAQNPST